MLVFVGLVQLVGCADDASKDPTPTRVYEAGEPACSTNGRPAPALSVFANFQPIGTAANALAGDDEHLWVVESTSNTVSRFHLDSARFDPYFIDIGDGQNPYDVAVDAELGRAYISNWLTNSLSVAELKTGEITHYIGPDSSKNTTPDTSYLDAPQGVSFSDAYIYVANSGYRGPGDYAPGSVSIFERDSLEFIAKIETTEPNTSFVLWAKTALGPRLIVVNTGAIEINNTGAFVRSAGSVELWAERDDPLQPERESHRLELVDNSRFGAPGRPVLTPDRRFIYLPSATAPLIFKLDIYAGEWVYDTDSPLQIDGAKLDQDGTHDLAADSRGLLYLTAFNEDALYIIDTACDQLLAGPIDLAQTDAQLEGVQTPLIVESATSTTLYFTATLANSLGKVELDYHP